MLGLGVAMIAITLLRLLVPGFHNQRAMSHLAELVNQSDAERLRQSQSAIVRSLAERMRTRSRDKPESKLRFRYRQLGYREPYEIYIVRSVGMALLPSIAMLFLGLASGELFFWIVSPMIAAVLSWYFINRIQSAYQKRQSRIIADLPFLIGQMTVALEVGRPLTGIFEEVSRRCDPPLAAMLKRLIANMNIMPQKEALALFAAEVDVPIMLEFTSTVNVIADKGFYEAEEDLSMIKDGLRSLSKQALRVKTRGNPAKMNVFYALVMVHVIVFMVLMMLKMFAAMNSI